MGAAGHLWVLQDSCRCCRTYVGAAGHPWVLWGTCRCCRTPIGALRTPVGAVGHRTEMFCLLGCGTPATGAQGGSAPQNAPVALSCTLCRGQILPVAAGLGSRAATALTSHTLGRENGKYWLQTHHLVVPFHTSQSSPFHSDSVARFLRWSFQSDGSSGTPGTSPVPVWGSSPGAGTGIAAIPCRCRE